MFFGTRFVTKSKLDSEQNSSSLTSEPSTQQTQIHILSHVLAMLYESSYSKTGVKETTGVT